MKYLFSFLESDSWSGSLYSYTIKAKPLNDKIFPDKKRIDFKCQNCGFDFFTFNKKPDTCEVCDSENLVNTL